MAERLEQVVVKAYMVTHHFDCDDCGKHIGSSDEFQDGYYEQLGERRVELFIPKHGWFRAKRCLCDDCNESWMTQVIELLRQMGFKKDGDTDGR